MEILRGAKYYGKLKKTEFLKPAVKYLGFIVDKDGCRVDPTKVDAINKITPPTTLT